MKLLENKFKMKNIEKKKNKFENVFLIEIILNIL